MYMYTITEIDFESFPADCRPDWTVEELPIDLCIESIDKYRTDAAQGGVLAHSPYCPVCWPDDTSTSAA